jgi:hypothetical protein
MKRLPSPDALNAFQYTPEQKEYQQENDIQMAVRDGGPFPDTKFRGGETNPYMPWREGDILQVGLFGRLMLRCILKAFAFGRFFSLDHDHILGIDGNVSAISQHQHRFATEP